MPFIATIAQQVTTIIGLQNEGIILSYQLLFYTGSQVMFYQTSKCYYCNDLQLRPVNISSSHRILTLNTKAKP